MILRNYGTRFLGDVISVTLYIEKRGKSFRNDRKPTPPPFGLCKRKIIKKKRQKGKEEQNKNVLSKHKRNY